MASKSRPTQLKRQRERAQAERRTQKEQRRQEAKARRASLPPRSGDEDPDIAGIVPGPQPLPYDLDDLEDVTDVADE
jgi:sRNA-binding protein